MRAAIDAHRNGTSIRAQSGLFYAKKSGLQSICRTMLVPNRARIRTRPEPSFMAFVQADTPDQAARAKMTIQTGPKTQFGGFHGGLRRSAYQEPTVVVQPPTARTTITVTLATTIGMGKGNTQMERPGGSFA
jgi:hypothetical protein